MVGGGAIRAGRAFVELFAVDKELEKGLRAAQYKLRRFGGTVRAMGTMMVGFGGGILVGLGAATKVAADFEHQMAFVSTMLDEPQKHMERFSQGIRRMSVEFGESTDTLARGLYDILSASIAPEHALDVLAVSARAANAGMTDTAVAADAITTILNAYGLSGEHAADVSDLLFGIVRRGKTTFAELAPVIGLVASTAAAGGVSLEEFGAALATMTRNGVRTQNAITALNAIVSSFLKPEKDAAAFARQLGFEMSSATLKAEGLAGVFGRISQLPPDAIARLFPNIRALRGVLPALGNMEGFAEDLDRMAARSGASLEAFARIADQDSYSLGQLKQEAVDTARQVGQALLPTVGRMSGGLRDWFARNKDLIASAAPMAAGIGAVALAAGGLLLTVGALAGAVAALLNPVGLAIGGIAVLAGGLGALAVKERLASDGIARTREEIERQGRSAGELLGNYEDLVRNTERTAEEQLNLEIITRRLKDLYPQYAEALDGTAESLDALLSKTKGMTQMQAGLELEVTDKSITALEDKIQGLERMADTFEKRRHELKRKLEEGGPGLMERWLGRSIGMESPRHMYDTFVAALQDIYKETRKANGELEDMQDYREELQGILSGDGPEAGAHAGGAPDTPTPAPVPDLSPPPPGTTTGEDPDTAASERARIEERAADRLMAARIQDIDDEMSRELALVVWRYQKETEAAEGSAGAIAALREAQIREMYQVWRRFQQRKEEEERRAAERRAGFNQQTAEDIQDMMVDAYIPPGLERDLAHLRLEMQRAIAEAADIGASQEQVRQKFELKAELMARGVETAMSSSHPTFSGEAAWGLGGGGGQMADLLRIERQSRDYLQKLLADFYPSYT